MGLVPLHLKESQSNVWIQTVDVNTFSTVSLYGIGAPKGPCQHQCSAGSASGGSLHRGRWYSGSCYSCVINSKGNDCASWDRSSVGALRWYSRLCMASASGLRDKGWTFFKNHSKGFIWAENHKTCEWSILLEKVRSTLSVIQDCQEVTVGFSSKTKDFQRTVLQTKSTFWKQVFCCRLSNPAVFSSYPSRLVGTGGKKENRKVGGEALKC